jgi:hypothetical protein
MKMLGTRTISPIPINTRLHALKVTCSPFRSKVASE